MRCALAVVGSGWQRVALEGRCCSQGAVGAAHGVAARTGSGWQWLAFEGRCCSWQASGRQRVLCTALRAPPTLQTAAAWFSSVCCSWTVNCGPPSMPPPLPPLNPRRPAAHLSCTQTKHTRRACGLFPARAFSYHSLYLLMHTRRAASSSACPACPSPPRRAPRPASSRPPPAAARSSGSSSSSSCCSSRRPRRAAAAAGAGGTASQPSS